MRQILVAVDDSAASERAAAFVNRFFADLDVKITAVNVGSAPLGWGPYAAPPGLIHPWSSLSAPAAAPPPVVGADADRGFDVARDTGARTIESSGIQAEDEVVEFGGGIADTLIEVARERGVDLIVVGSNHKSMFDRLLSPSVSKDLAESAPVPVLIVH